MYLTMLDVWQSQPDSGPSTGQQLTVLPPSSVRYLPSSVDNNDNDNNPLFLTQP